MLKVVGKQINGSDTGEALIEAGICEPRTMEQIKAGKHYKNCFEAMLTIYFALSFLSKENFFKENIVLKVSCEKAIEVLKNDANLLQLTDDLDDLQLLKQQNILTNHLIFKQST